MLSGHPTTSFDLLLRRASTIAALAAAITACGPDAAPPPTPPPTTAPTTVTTSPSTTSTTVIPVVGTIVWNDPSSTVDLGDGWTAAACEGAAPLICVSRDERRVGLVEVNRFPLESLAPGTTLASIADEFVASFTADRASGCGADYEVAADTPAEATVAGESGLRFGFTGRLGDGVLSERVVQHGLTDGPDVVLFTAAAYAADGCPGRDGLEAFTPEDLIEFEDLLALLVASVPLPPAA